MTPRGGANYYQYDRSFYSSMIDPLNILLVLERHMKQYLAYKYRKVTKEYE